MFPARTQCGSSAQCGPHSIPPASLASLSVSKSALLSPVTCRLSLATTDTPAWLVQPLARAAPITCRVCPSSPERRAHQDQREQGQAGHSEPPAPTHLTQGHPIVDLPDPLSKTSDPTPLPAARTTQLRSPRPRLPRPAAVVPQGGASHRRVLALASSKGQGSCRGETSCHCVTNSRRYGSL